MSDEYWDLIAAGRYDDALRFALANTPESDFWFTSVGGRDRYVRHAWENHVADAKDSRTDHRLKLADRRRAAA